MPTWMLLFVAVVSLLPHASTLLQESTAWLGVVVSIFLCRVAPKIIAPLVGVAWVTLNGHYYLDQRLPITMEGRPLLVDACVKALFAPFDGRYRQLRLEILSVHNIPELSVWRGEVIVGDYQGWPVVAGHCYSMELKLKRPHSYHNFLLPDRGAAAVMRGIAGQGYIKDVIQPLPNHVNGALLRWRSVIQDWLLQSPLTDASRGLLAALIIGDKSLLNAKQWQQSIRSGTVHLLVVSGLHIGFMSLSMYWLVYALAALWPGLYGVLSRQHQAWLGAWFAGMIFALLSGWALPAQRAVIMLSVAVLFVLLNKRSSPWLGWGVALLAVLCWQPMASLSLGFWLSFGMVTALMASIQLGRWWQSLLMAQGRCLIFSTPLLWWQMGTISWISPLINFVLVPAMSILLPLLMLLTLAAAIHSWFWWPLQQLLWVLEWCFFQASAPAWAFGFTTSLSWVQVLVLIIGSVWLLLPAWIPMRFLGVLLILACAVLQQEPSNNALRMTAFDVGQGSAVLLQSGDASGLFDTGPRYGDFSLMQSVILPSLRLLGIARLDQVWVSHSDIDHSGGWAVLKQSLHVSNAALPKNEICQRNQHWQLGLLSITALWPDATYPQSKTNNQSCSLLIEVAGRRILLPGDIEATVERHLLSAGLEPVDVLFVPHHGSKTSSTEDFVNTLKPRHIIVESGYRNRYGHPVKDVLERYANVNARLWHTARDGGILIEVDLDGELNITSSRHERPAFWH